MIRPLSFLLGRDHTVLEQLIELHAKPNPRILDVTYGKGTMWKKTKYKPLRMDIDPEKGLDYIGDFCNLREVWRRTETGILYPTLIHTGSIDVMVFDPPHLTDAGKNSNINRGGNRYGLEGVKGKNIVPMFEPFLREAQRVLSQDGIILAKIADQVHNSEHQWHQVDFINAVRAVGLTPCDQIIKVDPAAGKLMGLWKRVFHTRNSHCYWIVVRKGKCCRPKRYADSA